MIRNLWVALISARVINWPRSLEQLTCRSGAWQRLLRAPVGEKSLLPCCLLAVEE